MWMPCATREAQRTSGHPCGSSTPADTAGRASRGGGGPSAVVSGGATTPPPGGSEAPDRSRLGDSTDRSAEALAAAPLLGIAYGYCGAPDQWWQQQVVQGLHR